MAWLASGGHFRSKQVYKCCIVMFRIVFALFVALAVFSSSTFAERACDKPNEEYACGSACQTSCETLGQPCSIINVKCNEECYCIEGYARDNKGVCIPQEQCPDK